MSVLDDEVFQGKKYILAVDFINLAASTTKDYIDDIASYLVLNNFDKEVSSYLMDKYSRVTRVEHSQSHDYDVNTRNFLENCHSKVILSKSISLRLINDLKGDFYYSYEELESIRCIKKLKLELTAEAARVVRDKVRKYDENEIHFIYRKPIDKPEEPNAWQLNYFKLERFDIKTAACLLAGIEVRLIDQHEGESLFAEVFADYISYKLMFELAIDNNEVSFDDDLITSEDLQKYLFRIGYVLKGFNDWLRIEPAKPLVDVQLPVIDSSLPKTPKVDHDEFTEKYEVLKKKHESLNKEFDKIKKQLMDATVELDDNTAASYQTTIGILLEIMKAPKGTEDKPAFPSEAAIIGLATEEAIFRQGKTSLENRFGVAKEALANERKKPHNLKRSSNPR